MPILRVMLSFSSQRLNHSMFVPLTTAQPALRGGRKWNEELTDRARYCTFTTGQSPGNPCADSQDVALIHRPRPRRWGPGKGEHGEHGLGLSPADERVGVGGSGECWGLVVWVAHTTLRLSSSTAMERIHRWCRLPTACPTLGRVTDRLHTHTHTHKWALYTHTWLHTCKHIHTGM